MIRSRVKAATSGLSLSASDTVAVETPSVSAMVDSFTFCATIPPGERAAFKTVYLNSLNSVGNCLFAGFGRSAVQVLVHGAQQLEEVAHLLLACRARRRSRC